MKNLAEENCYSFPKKWMRIVVWEDRMLGRGGEGNHCR